MFISSQRFLWSKYRLSHGSAYLPSKPNLEFNLKYILRSNLYFDALLTWRVSHYDCQPTGFHGAYSRYCVYWRNSKHRCRDNLDGISRKCFYFLPTSLFSWRGSFREKQRSLYWDTSHVPSCGRLSSPIRNGGFFRKLSSRSLETTRICRMEEHWT